ncbi:hypothetical protein M2322_003174 [Rhodoblastus acidophilus]|nr:hypothetical protein [Rhodoblastus acidophilus]
MKILTAREVPTPLECRNHDIAHRLLLGPAGGNARGAHFPDARHIAEPCWFGLDDFEGVHAKKGDDSLGELRPNDAHHAGAEVFLYSLGRRRSRRFQEFGLELQPVRPVREPNADGVNELAGRYRGDMANDRHQVAMAARLDLQDSEAVVLVVEGNAFDGADKRVLRRRCIVIWFHLIVAKVYGEKSGLRQRLG